MARSRRDALNVFVNAPFDPAYDPLLEAMVFMIHAAGFRARCALEENDSGDIRLDKLVRLIDESPRSIHDLSRTMPVGQKTSELTRFNMPLELGLCMGSSRLRYSPRYDKLIDHVGEPYNM